MKEGKRRRGVRLALLSLLLLFLGGCWSKEELNDRSFATALMVDLTEQGDTVLSIGFFLPNRITNGQTASTPQKPYTMRSGTGRNLAEAYQKIQRTLPRRITWGTMRVVIVGDRMARAGIRPIAEFLLRLPEIRLSSYLFYYRGEAREINGVTPVFERFPSEIMREYAHMNLVPPVMVKDVLYSLTNNFGDGFLPELVVEAHDHEMNGQEKSATLVNRNVALLRDGKKVAMTTFRQTLGIRWLMRDIEETIETVPSPLDGKPFSLRLMNETRRLKVAQVSGRLRYKLVIRAKAELITSDSTLDLTRPSAIGQLEKAVSAQIQSEIKDAVAAAKANKVDAFQWSEYVRWKYPQLWQGRKEEERARFFTDADLEVKVDISLQRLGSSRAQVESG